MKHPASISKYILKTQKKYVTPVHTCDKIASVKNHS